MFGFYGAVSILVGAGIWLGWIRRMDRLEPEAVRDLIRVGLLGGAFAIVLAMLLGIPLLLVHPMPLHFALAGLNEEVAKSWATLVLLKRRDLVDEPVDVLVYALTVALGFALIENLLYFLPGRPYVPITRTLYSVPAHLCFTLVWAVPLTPALWGARAKRHPFLAIGPYVGAAGLVHGATNTILATAKGWPLHLWMAVPLVVMLLLGRHFLKSLSDRSPFQPLNRCVFCGREADSKRRARCERCGSPLARTFFSPCPTCEGPVPPAARFCQHCGTAQPSGASHVP